MSLEKQQNSEIVAVDQQPRFYVHFGKRIFDVAFALLILPFILFVLFWVLLAMVLTGERRSLLFGHRRIGKDGRVFKCWKIRTMVVDAERKLHAYLADNPDAAAQWKKDHKLDNDPRITALGQFLRRTSLDELPQIWNVIKGEMSFVGPRPIVRSELHKYGVHRRIYTSVRPGVTGLWQVSGRNDISYDERVQMDLSYVRNIGFPSDVSLVAHTIKAVLKRTGK
jgi:lipopolysaccharide/colanic/teichoic acid biosynthesis glycosyltransferase